MSKGNGQITEWDCGMNKVQSLRMWEDAMVEVLVWHHVVTLNIYTFLHFQLSRFQFQTTN